MKKNILITAGPTREWMDPVRFLSNPSSGAMGIALAERLALRGVKVTLVLGPTWLKPSRKIKTIRVVTALEMHAAVMRNLARTDAFVATAAVGDWRFERVTPNKIKKNSKKNLTVTLVKNPDILAEVGRMTVGEYRRTMKSNPLLVGFSLESENLKKNALVKLRQKNLDLIVANSPESFSSSLIRPTWIEKNGKVQSFPKMTKNQLADKLITWLEGKWKSGI